MVWEPLPDLLAAAAADEGSLPQALQQRLCSAAEAGLLPLAQLLAAHEAAEVQAPAAAEAMAKPAMRRAWVFGRLLQSLQLPGLQWAYRSTLATEWGLQLQQAALEMLQQLLRLRRQLGRQAEAKDKAMLQLSLLMAADAAASILRDRFSRLSGGPLPSWQPPASVWEQGAHQLAAFPTLTEAAASAFELLQSGEGLLSWRKLGAAGSDAALSTCFDHLLVVMCQFQTLADPSLLQQLQPGRPDIQAAAPHLDAAATWAWRHRATALAAAEAALRLVAQAVTAPAPHSASPLTFLTLRFPLWSS